MSVIIPAFNEENYLPQTRPKSIMTHGDYVVLGPDLQILSVETGKVLWTKKTKAKTSRGMFVAQDQIWILSNNDKHVTSFDLATGEKRTVIDTADFYSAGHHPRCHASKSSENYLITPNRGSEFISLTGGEHIPNDWARGACKYGIMPGNGMLYVPPDPCFCYPNQSIKGLNALTPAPKTPLTEVSPKSRLQRGPAYKDVAGPVKGAATPDSGEGWPMYRRDPKRSGTSPTALPPRLARVIQGRYGLAGVRPHTLAAVGTQLGLSGERVRQLQQEGLAWLRHPAHSWRLRQVVGKNRAADYRRALAQHGAWRRSRRRQS